MISRYITLQNRVRNELSPLEQTVEIVLEHWRKASQQPADSNAYYNSVALSLQNFYTGLEHIFEIVATELDGSVPRDNSWHASLLEQMTLELPGVRPALLTRETFGELQEYMRFRHIVRNLYGFELEIQRMEPLVERLPQVWQDCRQDIGAFLAYLDQMAHADDGD